MKNHLLLIAALAFVLGACRPKADSLIGTWTVDKVNVHFDEQRSTPELVKQIGEMEKQNTITISNDSTLVFKGLEITLEGRLDLKNNGTMLVDGVVLGQWENGHIITRSGSPLGEVIITYKKE
ncbi:MAG: hypothetical protein IKH44_06070 [Bacteroidales bacterium]|nr:hypothetical protein [Bacteroidales bacterium]